MFSESYKVVCIRLWKPCHLFENKNDQSEWVLLLNIKEKQNRNSGETKTFSSASENAMLNLLIQHPISNLVVLKDCILN